MNDAADAETKPGLAPWSLKDAPSFIERQFPVGRLSAEAYEERTAAQSQTLTPLSSYWKGRKPLILVRLVVLGCLLPTTDNPAIDLSIFLKLMGMDDAAFGRRFNGTASEFARLFPAFAELATEENGRRRVWRQDLTELQRQERVAEAFSSLPYAERLKHVNRPEECDETSLLTPIWREVNSHLGTTARTIADLVEQLGIARFGHRPLVADTFCGGGSIPFEAARVGCDVYASDLNPIACMLTWGAFNIIGANTERRAEIENAQKWVSTQVDAEITRLGIEHDANGNRAKAYLYCLETRCPKTGWMVPMAPSWVISRTRRVIAKLVPDHASKRYIIEIHEGVSPVELAAAEKGTVEGGRLIHPMNPEHSGVDIRTIRGDYRGADGANSNRLRPWQVSDFIPNKDDIFLERLYCIQWIAKYSINKGRQETFFRSVTEDDIVREQLVETLVKDNLSGWQAEGLVPNMRIEPGDNTSQPIRERGWNYWHQMFGKRELFQFATFNHHARTTPFSGILILTLCRALDWNSRLCGWRGPAGKENNAHVFANQALNTLWNYVSRSFETFDTLMISVKKTYRIPANWEIAPQPANEFNHFADIFVTDPPYADAVNYHEITDFFISWIKNNPPPPFDAWNWHSRRDLAIKGKDEHFRRAMVSAYTAMAQGMPDHGLQVVMFTHQDAGVWADLASILWAAGLRVTAAWNVVTETENALKDGNYVQGTVCLILRKRLGQVNARRMEIEAEIENAVVAQLSHLNALDDAWHQQTNGEALHTDGDLTLAAYAAALQVVTSYSTIDRQPLDRDLYRKLGKNETTMLRDLIDYAAQVANSLLVPEGFLSDMWRDLGAAERFYVRMLDMEAKGSAKVADFQNFAKSFAFGGYAELMASSTPNAAALAGAADLKGRMLSGEGFWDTQLRQVLFAVWKTMETDQRDPKRGVLMLKTEYVDYWTRRQKLIALADYVAQKTQRTRPEESAAAAELAEALKLDRL